MTCDESCFQTTAVVGYNSGENGVGETRLLLSRWPTASPKVYLPTANWRNEYYSEYLSEEDSLDRWPWIQEVREDGTLFYLESYVLRHNEGSSPGAARAKISNGPSPRRLRLGKLKQALRGSRSSKKGKHKLDRDIEEKGYNNSTVNNNVSCGSDRLNADLERLKLSREISNPLINVDLKVPPGQFSTDATAVSLLEEIFGIISGLDLDPVVGERSSSLLASSYAKDDADAVVIQGLLAGKPAAAHPEIAIGDILVAIASVEVTIHNVNKVMSAICEPCEVTLTIEKRPVVICPGQGQSKLFDLVAGSIEDDTTLIAHQEACAVMYLTLDSTDDGPDDDVLYWYPKTLGYSKLRKIRGMFLTIGDLMDKVTSSNAKSSRLVMDYEAMTVCYLMINSNILAIAVPETKAKAFQLEQQVNELERLLGFMFGTLEEAFLDVNRTTLNHLVALSMERLLLGLPVKTQGSPSNQMAGSLGGVRCLHLPAQNQVHISSILSDAEAADYGECIDDFFPHRRLYSTLGTAMFYKGHLICNHLPDDDLQDCVMFCKNHCLFALTEQHRVNQMVVWKEVFPTRRSRVGQCVVQKECMRLEEPDGRYFLLVVGLKHSVLCMLLEAGGVASMPEGSPGPHPYYVDTALSIIAYVQETLDFETICEARLRGPAIPALFSPTDSPGVKQTATAVIGYDISGASKKQMPRAESKLSLDSSRSAVRPGEESPLLNGNYSLSHSRKDSQDSQNSRSSSSIGSGGQRRSVATSASSDHAIAPRPTLSRKSTAVGVVGDFASLISTKLTEGPTNALFYYASFDFAKGIVVCPTTPVSTDAHHQEIMRNFFKASTLIRGRFLRQTERHQAGPDRPVGKGPPKLHEFGMQFTMMASSRSGDAKKWREATRYWVIGRRLALSEFYVCYEHGIPQNTIEMAFKLGFGTIL